MFNQSVENLVEREFLEALLEENQSYSRNSSEEEIVDPEKDGIYPWNPLSREADNYFCLSEEDINITESIDSQDLAENANNFFSHLNQCWESESYSKVKESLWQEFGNIIPEEVLETIASQAEEIFTTNISRLQQLVECVKPILSNWGEEDLQVFARPLAYAMRGKQKIKKAPWAELSPIEQARLSMKIAQYALMELKSYEENNISN